MAKTVEELKAAIREYAETNHINWQSVSVTIVVGELGESDDFERLLVTADCRLPLPVPLPQHSSSREGA